MCSFRSLSAERKAAGATEGQWRAGWSYLPTKSLEKSEQVNEAFLKNVPLSGELLSAPVRSARARHSAAAAACLRVCGDKIRASRVRNKRSGSVYEWLFPYVPLFCGGGGEPFKAKHFSLHLRPFKSVIFVSVLKPDVKFLVLRVPVHLLATPSVVSLKSS